MVTYVFTDKTNANIFYTSQFSRENAWAEAKKVLKDPANWRLVGKVDSDFEFGEEEGE